MTNQVVPVKGRTHRYHSVARRKAEDRRGHAPTQRGSGSHQTL